MASISRTLQRIKDDLAKLVPAEQVERACRELKHVYRRRKLDPLTTIHLFVQQVLNYNTAISHLPHLGGIEFDPSAYCVARQRLPLQLLQRVLKRVCEAARDEANTAGLWEAEHRVLLLDGSACSMPDVPALQKEFGQPGGQKPGCGFPVAKLLGLFDAYSGMMLELLADPLRTHEMSKVSCLVPLLRAGDVVVGDRGFCSYAHLALLRGAGVHAVFRLHQRYVVRFGGTSGRRARKDKKEKRKRARGRTRSRHLKTLGKCDQVVRWSKPQRKPDWMSQTEFDALPPTVTLRELRFAVKDRGCRTKVVTLVTTLVDGRRYTKAKLARLYKLRWSVEQDLKSLKQTLRMDVLKCRSAEGVRKELAAFALVYNLVCLVRRRGAEQQELEPRRVSFVDVLRWMQVATPGDEIPRFLVNPLRPGRHEPRVVKRRPKKYTLLNRPRAQYTKPRESPAKKS